MTEEKKITKGLDKELMQLIDAEMNDPVLGKLLNRNAAYVLGKEIKLLFIDKACKWLEKKACLYIWENCEQGEHGIHKIMLEDFRKAMKGE